MFKLQVLVSVLVLLCGAYSTPEGGKVLEENLKDVKSIIDVSQNPCTNFIKYACGSLKDKSKDDLFPYPYKYRTDINVMAEFIKDDKITSKMALKAKDYFKSCELAKPKDVNCYRATMIFFRSVVISEFYELYYTEEDKKIDMSIYEEFLKSYDVIKGKFVSPDEYIVKRAERRLAGIKNIKDELSREKIEKLYDTVVIDSKNFVANTEMLKTLATTGDWMVKSDKLNELFSEIIFPHYRMKPLFYHYAEKSTDLWWSFFRANSPAYKSDELKTCAKTLNDVFNLKPIEKDFDLADYPSRLAGIIQGFRDFERTLKNGEKYDEIYKKLELTPQKSFFISAAQVTCSAKSNEKNEEFYRLFLNMEEFYKAFECPSKKCFNIDL